MSVRNGKAKKMKTNETIVSSSASSTSSSDCKNQLLRGTLALTVLSFVTFLITLTSSDWVVITYPADFFAVEHNLFIVRSTYGVVWECVLGRPNVDAMYENQCDYHQKPILNYSLPAEQTLTRMTRTMLSFSAIHILLLIITFICGLYSIRDCRYTYKRLTGMLYIVTAVSLLVCIEVLSIIFRHASAHLPHIYPSGAKHSYGICYFLAWLIFIQLLSSSFIFFVCSRKRKGIFDAATEEEAMANQPVDLGRL